EVFALGLGALSDAPRDGPLDLVRRAEPPVTHLHPGRESDRILNAEPAPCRTDAALHGSQRLAVGVATLETGRDQLRPDLGEEMHRRAEEVNALAAGDLGVKTVLAGDFPQDDELLRSDLTAWHARHHGVQAAALDIGEEAVVGVLKRRVSRAKN